MFDQEFKSLEEIDKSYEDHLDSLTRSGIPFNREDIVKEWVNALKNFEEKSTIPPWLDSRF